GEVPADVVAQTSRCLAFRDRDPKAPTHVLVVPVDHVAHAGELGPEHADLLAEMFTTARSVAEGDGVAESGYRLVFNVGDDAGNTVAHLHLHVLGGRAMAWPPG
nr:HIT domain-containing protein [Actinomycetota bacterium]